MEARDTMDVRLEDIRHKLGLSAGVIGFVTTSLTTSQIASTGSASAFSASVSANSMREILLGHEMVGLRKAAVRDVLMDDQGDTHPHGVRGRCL